MATNRPSYQHVRTYNSGVNGDGQPSAGTINEGELAINLATKRVYTSRRAVTYFPPDSENTLGDSDHVRVGNAFYNGSPTTLKIGAKFRIFSITGFDSEDIPMERRYSGMYLTIPAVPNATEDVPAHYRWRMNGGQDSELSAHIYNVPDPAPNQLISFTTPLTLDSEEVGAITLPGLGKKMEWFIGKSSPFTTRNQQIQWNRFDSDYANRQGWYSFFDATPLSANYPDSGTLYIWYDGTYVDSENATTTYPQITRPANIVPDSDFIRYCDFTQEDLYAVIQDSEQKYPAVFPFYNGAGSPSLENSVIELLVDSTTFLPEFTSRVFASFTPQTNAGRAPVTYYRTSPTTLSSTIVLGGLQGNSTNPLAALQPYARLRTYTGDDEVFTVNNVPYVGAVPPGYGVDSEAYEGTTGDFWINNTPGDSDTYPTPGKLSWLDDTLFNNAYAQGYARYLAQNVVPPGTPDDERRAAMLRQYNLAYIGPTNRVLDPDTKWAEWRATPGDTWLTPRPEDEPYVPDYGLRINPIALGAYEPNAIDTMTGNYVGNPRGIDSDAWTAFINTLDITSARAGQAVRKVLNYYGPPTRLSPTGVYYYLTDSTVIAADVFYNGARLIQGVDYELVTGLGVTPLPDWAGPAPNFPLILPTDSVTVVTYSPIIRETTVYRTIVNYIWGQGGVTTDSDLVLPVTVSVEADLSDVLVNGVYQIRDLTSPSSYDYSYKLLPDGSYYVDFDRELNEDDSIVIIGYIPSPIPYAVGRRRVTRFRGPAAAFSTFSVPHYVTDSDSVDVQLNGVSLEPGSPTQLTTGDADYSFTTIESPPTTTITIAFTIDDTSRLNVITYGTDFTSI